jgi:hypothetical protein
MTPKCRNGYCAAPLPENNKGGSRCSACAQYFRRTGRERPRDLVARAHAKAVEEWTDQDWRDMEAEIAAYDALNLPVEPFPAAKARALLRHFREQARKEARAASGTGGTSAPGALPDGLAPLRGETPNVWEVARTQETRE